MIVYTVQKGDSLWKIAQRHQICLDALIAANPQIPDPNFIQIGQQLNIPELWQPAAPVAGTSPDLHGQADLDSAAPRNSRPMAMPECDTSGCRPCIYITVQGDTLEAVGHKFMVPLSQLIYFNLRYAKAELLPPGTRLIIPESQPAHYPAQSDAAGAAESATESQNGYILREYRQNDSDMQQNWQNGMQNSIGNPYRYGAYDTQNAYPNRNKYHAPGNRGEWDCPRR